MEFSQARFRIIFLSFVIFDTFPATFVAFGVQLGNRFRCRLVSPDQMLLFMGECIVLRLLGIGHYFFGGSLKQFLFFTGSQLPLPRGSIKISLLFMMPDYAKWWKSAPPHRYCPMFS